MQVVIQGSPSTRRLTPKGLSGRAEWPPLLHISQVRGTSGYIVANLTFDMWTRWTSLNWVRKGLAQSDDLCVEFWIKSHRSASIRFPKSRSHAALVPSNDKFGKLVILWYPFERVPLDTGFMDSKVSMGSGRGLLGNLVWFAPGLCLYVSKLGLNWGED